MGRYRIVERRDVALVSEQGSRNRELLSKLFCDNNYVYVEAENHCLLGVISYNDFERKFDAGSHVNPSFHAILEEEITAPHADQVIESREKEIPVLNVKGEMIYLLQKKKHIINSFDFDWSLCDIAFVQDFFEDVENAYYFSEDSKISGLKKICSDFVNVQKIDYLPVCTERDILLYTCNPPQGIRSYHIDEVFLSILSRTAVRLFKAKGIHYYFFQMPIYEKLRLEKQQEIDKNKEDWSEEQLQSIYQDYDEDVRYWLLRDYEKVKLCEIEGKYLLKNAKSETYNVIDCQRLTTNQPEQYEHTIWVAGACIVRGYGASDVMTIPSILQKRLLQENHAEYIVRNLGTGGGINCYMDIRDFVNLMHTELKRGDMVVQIGYNCWDLEKSKVEFDEYYELSWLLNRKYDKKCFLDYSPHLTPYANEIVADYIYENIEKTLQTAEA